jgi:hypothetical protein
MKKLFIILVTAATVACSSNTQKPAEANQSQDSSTYFGSLITPDDAMNVNDIQKLMGDSTQMQLKLTGQVADVCQTKGCWMSLKKDDGTNLRVIFKDYGFFVPKDCAGKTAVIEGIARIETTSIDDLKEYAKDGGKTEAEIAAITEPKNELVFEASGVILK